MLSASIRLIREYPPNPCYPRSKNKKSRRDDTMVGYIAYIQFKPRRGDIINNLNNRFSLQFFNE